MSPSRYKSHSTSAASPFGQNQKSRPVQQTTWQHVVQRAQADPGSLTPSDVKVLQRSIGNRATTRLLAPVLSQTTVQKEDLTLGATDDKYEREADQVADQVVHSSSASAPQPVQRKEDRTPTHGPEGGTVEQGVQRQIQQMQGRGQPLDEGVRREMEQGFGRDFGRVRIHTDSQADTLNRSLNARAFTVGNDIVFRKGEFQPATASGKKLLAHELTHTVQQAADNKTVQTKQLTIQRETERRDLLTTIFQSDFRNDFYRFAEKEWSTENFDCMEAIQRYKKKPRRSLAIQIYQTFVKAGSDREINTDQSKRDAVYEKVKTYEKEKSEQNDL